MTRVLEVGGVIRGGEGTSYRYCRDRDEATEWIAQEAATASAS